MTASDRSAVARATWVALVVPVVVTAVAVALQLAWLGNLPDPVAIHWGLTGGPNGFAAPWVSIVITSASGLLLPVLVAAATIPALRRGAQGPTFRFMAALSAGMSVLMGVVATWALGMQRGLADASAAPSITPALLVGLAAGVVVGAVGWAVQPSQEQVIVGASAAEPLPVGPGERVMWTRTATAAPWLMLLLGGTTLVTVALAVAAWFTDPARAWTWLATTVVIVLAIAGTGAYTVRVDGDGLTVTAALGLPRFHVPLAEIDTAGTGDVVGLGEFGGYGIRHAPHTTGVILRNGPALRVRRTNGRYLVITVDDAKVAAALIEGLVERRARSRG